MEYINEEDYGIEPIKEFIPPPIGNSLPEEFNILYHVRLKKPKEEKVEKDPKKKGP